MSRAARVRELFDAIVELDGDEREERLVSLPADERAELEALLAADETDSPMLSAQWMANLVGPLQSQIGKRVGAYELVEILGSGGMGDVFLARRVEGEFDQEAAIKLVRRDLASPRVVERFAQERQILARLSHPGIARLLDGGVTDDGQPYLVMEVVNGVALDQHCEDGALALDERLRLFVRACEAVQHAHGNLVVHCDLKPDNILITDEGELKLLDFGIATAIGGDDQRRGAVAMTPTYAAPELFDGAGVTTAADVYSLGVILYQLLAGAPPIELDGLPAGERKRRVETTEIAAPQTSVDLAAICMRALERDPEDRYASPSALAADIIAVLEHRPVSARPRSFWYLAAKLARRHVMAFVALVASLAVIAGLVVFYTARLTSERDRARAEARRAAAVSKALVAVFTAADPANARGEPMSARRLLARGRAQIKSELAGQPRLLAEMLLVLGRVNFNLGYYSDAESLATNALEIEARFDPRSVAVADILSLVGDAQREQARFDDAEKSIRAALDLRRELRPDSLGVAKALLDLSALQVDRGDFSGGLESAEAALALRERLGSDGGTLAEAWHAIGGAQSERGDMRIAEASYRKAYELSLAAHGELHPMTVTALADLAYSLRKQLRFDEAEPLYRQALAARETLFNGDHPDIAYNLNHLGRLLVQKHEIEAAIPYLERALAMRRRLYGDSHAAVSASLGALSKALVDLGKVEQAEPMARESLEIITSIYGASHPYAAGATSSLAAVVDKLGRRAEALELRRRSVEIGRRVHEPQNPRLARLYIGLGKMLCAGKEKREGRSLLEEADEIFRAKLPVDHPERVALSESLVACR